MNTQEELADFITRTSLNDIDPLAMERARAAVIDTIGVAIAGSRTPLAIALSAFLRSNGDLHNGARSIILGSVDRASPSNAALYNGTIAHALDFDDLTQPATVHLSASLVPSVMSVTADRDLFTPDFYVAYVIGFEIASKIGRVLTRRKRGHPWHPTGTLNPIGCAAAVAKTLTLDRNSTSHALGMAASTGAGVRANFGTMTKPLHAGRAAQSGVTSALLASIGFDSSADAFDGATGYFRAFGTAAPDELALDISASLSTLGSPWEICTDVGLQLKPWPSAAATIPVVEAALALAPKIDVASIDRIMVGTGPSTVAALSSQARVPEDGLQAKFSVEFCVAAALRWKSVTMDTFTDARVHDPIVRELLSKISVDVDDRFTGETEHVAIVEVILRSGERFEERVDVVKGKAEHWMTSQDQQAKFEDTAGSVIGLDHARTLFAMLSSGNLDDWREVVRLLTNAHSLLGDI